ncbi:MAG: N-acetyltransferase DgcN [Kiloniellales bacterium]
MEIAQPYLLFLGDAPDRIAAKTAQGIAHWRSDICRGQLRLPGCRTDLGLPNLTLEEAVEAGCRTLVVGIANRGGVIGEVWLAVLERALELGLDLAAGLHNRLADQPRLAAAAKANGRRLHDVRHPTRSFDVASGKKRSGKRLLTVGTDCSVGKMYATLALQRALAARGAKATFRATGQTGILISGDGVSVDAVIADFISGATEWLTPDNEPDHWDLVEGQGSLFHASFAGVSLGLLHGAQPDALVLCHEPTRPHLRGLPDFPVPSLKTCMELNLTTGRLTNPAIEFVGVAVNTSQMESASARDYLKGVEDQLGMPALDPVKDDLSPIIERLV